MKKSLTEILIEKTSDKNFNLNRSFKVEKNKTLEYLLIVDKNISSSASRSFVLEAGAELNSYRLFLEAKKGEIFNFNHEIKAGAKIASRSLIVGLKKENFSLKADYNFAGEKSFGRIKTEALLANQAKLSALANVNVLAAAQKSDTRVDMSLILDGSGVRGEVIPGLNISANDVKAGHSAGTFRLKAEELFYLRSRGLSPEEIRRLFILSLVNNFTIGLSDKKIKEDIIKLIKKSL
ncbi:SufD family Fe-S cluster assembly protein [Patescibacteria group bacterium]|nr:SufD family Fe-S cluster assembly protein [Patescibacteria group bacterium]